ncbi:cupin domain-containing protein [Streptosporangium sp. NPDC000396]|uniref:cupin domain-containing protein n=1 Tax=Streptosporangium sp. NPDC000396 TaxID=3366185 RepID=UPI00368E3773
MTLVRHAESRRSETPNAVMTTLASPTLGSARSSIWRTEVKPDVKGPVHIFDVEQIWTFLEGEATIELDGETSTAGPGDTAVLPAHATRRLTAGPQGYTAIVTAPAGAHAWIPGDTGNKVTPPWIA